MDKPFVTVSVITYNSSKTIKETLDSIFYQTYPNLELIVSDDCSTDKTVSICKAWIDQHKNRFARAEVLMAEKNTGVTANINRAWSACRTVWNKDIAGDDILFPNCIEDNMSFIRSNPDAVVVFSRLKRFKTRCGKKIWLDDSWHDYSFFSLNQGEQYEYLIYHTGHIPTCTAFYNIDVLLRRNFKHDERIPLLEDDPKWIVLSKWGIKFHFLDIETVGYRRSSESLAYGLHSPQYFRSRLLFYLYYYLEEIKCNEDRVIIYELICNEAMKSYSKTYNEVLGYKESWDYKVGRFLLNPLHLLKHFIEKLTRRKGIIIA